MQSEEEIFDVCDDDDQVIGQASRSEVHRRNLLHRAVHIWVWNSNNELMLHLRSQNKDQFPGCYTSSASGHVDAGEDYATAAARELYEELQLTGNLEFQVKLAASPQTAYEHTALYCLHTDADINFDRHEIAAIEFLPFEQWSVRIEKHPESCTPSLRELAKWWHKQRP